MVRTESWENGPSRSIRMVVSMSRSEASSLLTRARRVSSRRKSGVAGSFTLSSIRRPNLQRCRSDLGQEHRRCPVFQALLGTPSVTPCEHCSRNLV